MALAFGIGRWQVERSRSILAVVYVPFLQLAFDTVALTLSDWIIILPLIVIPAAVAEISKFFVRRSERHGA